MTLRARDVEKLREALGEHPALQEALGWTEELSDADIALKLLADILAEVRHIVELLEGGDGEEAKRTDPEWLAFRRSRSA